MHDDASSFKTPREELTIILTRFFDIMFPIGIFFGGIGLAASVCSSLQHGLYTKVVVHTSMYLIAVLVLLFRRRIPVFFIFYVMLGIISTDIVYSLLQGGLATEGMMSLAFLAVFSGFFWGLRAGIVVVAIGAVVVSIIGLAECTGMVHVPPQPATPFE